MTYKASRFTERQKKEMKSYSKNSEGLRIAHKNKSFLIRMYKEKFQRL